MRYTQPTLLALALCCLPAFGYQYDGDEDNSPEASRPPHAVVAPDYDAHWLADMVRYDQGTVQISKLAASRAGSDDIRRIAARTANDEQDRIARFSDWYSGWYGITPESPRHRARIEAETHNDVGQLARLHGAAFDRRFVEVMSAHDRSGIAMAQEALQQAGRSEVKRAAQALIDSRQSEIDELQRLKS